MDEVQHAQSQQPSMITCSQPEVDESGFAAEE
jgi:hypothetical protein